MKRILLFFGILALLSPMLMAQYATNGTAVATTPNCYRLTQNFTTQAGSVWNLNQVDISKPFDLYFEVFLGCSNVGADGMAFVLQPVSTNIGSTGGGLGYQGITPSLAIEMDTYQNGGAPTNDPVFDHMAIMSNGVIGHTTPNNLLGPVSILPGNGNVEDCNWHDLRVKWDTATFTLQVYFDCSLRMSYTSNIVANIFNGNPNVFWGFTAATGGQTNEHRFCLEYVSFTESLRDTAICLNDTLQLSVGSGASFSWSPATGLSNPLIADPQAFPDTTTTYVVTVTDGCGSQRFDSLTIKVATPAQLVFSLGNDTTLCQGDTLLYDLTQVCVDYTWQNGDSLPIHVVRSPGTYWVDLENVCGISNDTVVIDYEVPPSVNLGNDTLICNGVPFALDATFVAQTAAGTQYLWQDMSTNATLSPTTSGVYWVDVTTLCGTVRDSIVITFGDVPLPFSLGNDTLLCTGQTLLLDATQPNVSYAWQDGSTNPTFTVIPAGGQYWVTASTICGMESDTLNATYIPLPIADIGNDTTLCVGTTLALTCRVLSPFWTYSWDAGQTGPAITVSAPGGYKVCVSNMCAETTCDSVTIDYLDIPSIDLGADTILCPGATLLLDITDSLATNYLWQDNSVLPTFLVTTAATYTGYASNRCGLSRDTIDVTYNGAPSINLGPDQELCVGQSANLNASGTYNDTFRWQDGSTNAAFSVTSTGLYWVEVSNDCGVARDSVMIFFENLPPAFSLGADPALCEGDSITFDISGPAGLTYIWSDGTFEPTLTVFTAGTYTAETRNRCGAAYDTVEIVFAALPVADLGQDLLLCTGDKVLLDVTQPGSSYEWQNGSTSPKYTIFTSGTFFVTVTNACGTDRDEMVALYDRRPQAIDLGPDPTACISDGLELDATVPETSTAPVQYLWRFGTTDSVLVPDHSATYWVEAKNRCGVSRDTIKVILEVLPNPDLGPDTLRCPDEEILLDATLPGDPSYRWHNGSPRNIFYAKEEGIYTVKVTNTCGTGTDSIAIRTVDCSCSLFMPSAFTPNADNVNDLFGPAYDCDISDVTFKVYNRWGGVVFVTDNPDEFWDGNKNGRPVMEGVYVWVLQYQGYRNKIKRLETKTGTVTVLR